MLFQKHAIQTSAIPKAFGLEAATRNMFLPSGGGGKLMTGCVWRSIRRLLPSVRIAPLRRGGRVYPITRKEPPM
jgi:hypothetical protein